MSFLLTPKAVAIWLVDNTSLTFEQIANACGLHHVEVQLIADGDMAAGVFGYDPTITGEISSEEISRCEKDPTATLKVNNVFIEHKRVKGKRSNSPIAKRRSKPDGILWLLSSYPQLSVQQIVRLIGTTAKVVNSIKDSSYWNMQGIKPRDPILLKLCNQQDLEEEILRVNISNETESRLISMSGEVDVLKLDND